MRGGGSVNVDGFGVAWWLESGMVSRYRNVTPIWSDPAVTEVLPQLGSPAIVAAVRSATVGMPIERAACAPFTEGRWAFSHNGLIPDWRAAMSAGPDPLLDPGQALELESATDSAALWRHIRGRLDSAAPDRVLRETVLRVLASAPAARLNLLLCDGSTLWATTCTHGLSARVDDRSAVLVSEPYDDEPGWRAIPDQSLVLARPGLLQIIPLSHDEGPL
jgi:glutamine amidotransferase